VDDILLMMSDRFIVPNAECYTAAIRTWKNAAIHQPDVSASNQQNSVRRTIELLNEMEVAHNQSTLVSISVSKENVNDVLEALTVSTHHSRTLIADELLSKLEQQTISHDGLSTLQPTIDSYIYALRVWSSIESIEKVAKGKGIVWRVKDNFLLLANQNSGSRKIDRVVEIFNEFVKLCGSYRPPSNNEGLQALSEALDAIHVMRSMGGLINIGGTTSSGNIRRYHRILPNSVTFSSLLTAVSNLLSVGSLERRVSVDKIFDMCCTDGMVDQNVLLCLRDAATDDQFASLVEAHSETVEGTKVVPESWTRKALGGKVISVDGRKTTPLGVDGEFKTTWGMNAFQMRRLLDHRNRNMLRGGRLRPPKHKSREPSQWKLYDSEATMTAQE
jgi:hypothetical protein